MHPAPYEYKLNRNAFLTEKNLENVLSGSVFLSNWMGANTRDCGSAIKSV
jgi:hypothetical protein